MFISDLWPHAGTLADLCPDRNECFQTQFSVLSQVAENIPRSPIEFLRGWEMTIIYLDVPVAVRQSVFRFAASGSLRRHREISQHNLLCNLSGMLTSSSSSSLGHPKDLLSMALALSSVIASLYFGVPVGTLRPGWNATALRLFPPRGLAEFKQT